jgi:hypothetical protein
VTQSDTHYDDGTVDQYVGSVVLICDGTVGGGFSPSASFQGVGSPRRLDESGGQRSSSALWLSGLLLAIALFLRRAPWTWGG